MAKKRWGALFHSNKDDNWYEQSVEGVDKKFVEEWAKNKPNKVKIFYY